MRQLYISEHASQWGQYPVHPCTPGEHAITDGTSLCWNAHLPIFAWLLWTYSQIPISLPLSMFALCSFVQRVYGFALIDQLRFVRFHGAAFQLWAVVFCHKSRCQGGDFWREARCVKRHLQSPVLHHHRPPDGSPVVTQKTE